MSTCDDHKRQSTLKKHELDFTGCEAVFDSPVVAWDDERETDGECASICWVGYRAPWCT